MSRDRDADGARRIGPTFSDILERRLDRRGFLYGLAVGSGLTLPVFRNARAVGSPAWEPSAGDTESAAPTFEETPPSKRDTVVVPPGYRWTPLARWGDPIHPSTPEFDFLGQTAEKQSEQIGYNCDYVGFFELPSEGGRERAVLTINHEFVDPERMFPHYDPDEPTREQAAVLRAAHGISVVEITRDLGGTWRIDPRSPLNRRITVDTPIEIRGPAAGHPWMKTGEDPQGIRVRGTLYNCAGGMTPWGTLLSCEENFHEFFAHSAKLDEHDPRAAAHRRYGVPKKETDLRWERFEDRFDASREPNEPFRFGWVVEVDPYRPDRAARKRTALGRFRHEGAKCCVAPDGRVVVYLG
ncbi:MAG: DUF839 domain-containing protein, partial [Candidatus Eisenbacteria bacterium]|nr:DUF839 domain-containing protein [Candidatus Eisenbacteria bacterium]